MLRPLLSLFFLMYAQTALTAMGRVMLFEPVMAARSAEHVNFAFAFDFHWPLARLPPTYFTFLAFFFFFFFFFLAFFFFFFFFFFLALGFLAFLAFFAFPC